jgi:hypothetical protein
MKPEAACVVDIWAGENSQDFVARSILSIEEALAKAKKELLAGNLVNLRMDLAWGEFAEFDNRVATYAA